MADATASQIAPRSASTASAISPSAAARPPVRLVAGVARVLRLGRVEGAVGVLREREAGRPVLVRELGQRHVATPAAIWLMTGLPLIRSRAIWWSGDSKGSHGRSAPSGGIRLGFAGGRRVPGRCGQGRVPCSLVRTSFRPPRTRVQPAPPTAEPDFADGYDVARRTSARRR